MGMIQIIIHVSNDAGSLGCSVWHPHTSSQLKSSWAVKTKPVYGYYTINRSYFGDGTGGKK